MNGSSVAVIAKVPSSTKYVVSTALIRSFGRYLNSTKRETSTALPMSGNFIAS